MHILPKLDLPISIEKLFFVMALFKSTDLKLIWDSKDKTAKWACGEVMLPHKQWLS